VGRITSDMSLGNMGDGEIVWWGGQWGGVGAWF